MLAAKSEDPSSIPWNPHGVGSFLRLKFTLSVCSGTGVFSPRWYVGEETGK